jgi:hypothetical protein
LKTRTKKRKESQYKWRKRRLLKTDLNLSQLNRLKRGVKQSKLKRGLLASGFIDATTCEDSQHGFSEDMRRFDLNGILKAANMTIQELGSIMATLDHYSMSLNLITYYREPL